MPSLEDQRFAQIASDKTFVNSDQLRTAMKIQEQTMVQGEVKSLADILAEQGAMDVTQIGQVKDAAEEAGPLQIGEFRIIKKLGEGGMGAVYHAEQTGEEREVALKLLPAHLARNNDLVARFKREALVSSRLDHPNIVRGLAVGEDRGQHYFAMEYVKGHGLDEVIEKDGPLPVDRAIAIMKQACEGLAAAHEAGVIHRDIKPANIMIAAGDVVKIADLGLVKQTDDEATRLTVTGSGMGTPSYMPPEQAKSAKHVDVRSDIYALGVTFYHMLTGDLPYKGETAYEVIESHESGRHKSPKSLRPEISTAVELIIEKMMARKPENRFQQVTEVLSALDRATGSAVAEIVQAQKEAKGATWYVRAPKGEKEVVYKLDEKTLRTLVRQGKVHRKAVYRMGEEGEFRPLGAFPQLGQLPAKGSAAAAQGKKTADKAKRGQELRSLYDGLEEEARRRRDAKRIKRFILRVVIPILLVAALAIVALVFKDQIMGLVRGGAE